MEDILQLMDMYSGALPFLAIIAGLLIFRKLLRLGLFVAVLGAVVLVLEHQDLNVVSPIVDAVAGLGIGEMFGWLLHGLRP